MANMGTLLVSLNLGLVAARRLVHGTFGVTFFQGKQRRRLSNCLGKS